MNRKGGDIEMNTKIVISIILAGALNAPWAQAAKGDGAFFSDEPPAVQSAKLGQRTRGMIAKAALQTSQGQMANLKEIVRLKKLLKAIDREYNESRLSVESLTDVKGCGNLAQINFPLEAKLNTASGDVMLRVKTKPAAWALIYLTAIANQDAAFHKTVQAREQFSTLDGNKPADMDADLRQEYEELFSQTLTRFHNAQQEWIESNAVTMHIEIYMLKNHWAFSSGEIFMPAIMLGEDYQLIKGNDPFDSLNARASHSSIFAPVSSSDLRPAH